MSSLLRALQLLFALVCAAAWAGPELPEPQTGRLTVYFLDVGQGDAALIVSPTGKTVLIDGGPPSSARQTAAKVHSVVKRPLDLVVLSHPHLDHLGGLAAILSRVGARNYMDPGYNHGTVAYERLLSYVADKGIALVEPSPGEDGAPFSLEIGGGAALSVYWPRRPREPFLSGTRSDANANSIILRLTHGETSFLFTGDAEADTEAKLLRSGVTLRSTVLKVPHHGSRYSSQAPFIARVAPKVAIVSAGARNEFGHPHGKTTQRYAKARVVLARTDVDGDIRAVSDGTSVTVHALGSGESPRALGTFADDQEAGSSVAVLPERDLPRRTEEVAPASGVEGRSFVASRRSKVFHRDDCPAVRKIAPGNLISFESRDDASSARRPAQDCHP